MRSLLAALSILIVGSAAAPADARDPSSRPVIAPASTLRPPPRPVAPPDPQNLAIAREIMDLMLPADRRARMLFAEARTALIQQMRALALPDGDTDPAVLAIIERFADRHQAATEARAAAHIPAWVEASARAYARFFTHEELLQIRAFAATPAGARFLSSNNELMNDLDVETANTAYLRAVLGDVQPIVDEMYEEVARHRMRQRQRR